MRVRLAVLVGRYNATSGSRGVSCFFSFFSHLSIQELNRRVFVRRREQRRRVVTRSQRYKMDKDAKIEREKERTRRDFTAMTHKVSR